MVEKLILNVNLIQNLQKAEEKFLLIFINLPTKGTFLDSNQISYPIKIKSDEIVFIICLIDNNPYWLVWSTALEQWFFECKIRLLEYHGNYCLKFTPFFVNNLPL